MLSGSHAKENKSREKAHKQALELLKGGAVGARELAGLCARALAVSHVRLRRPETAVELCSDEAARLGGTEAALCMCVEAVARLHALGGAADAVSGFDSAIEPVPVVPTRSFATLHVDRKRP